MNLCRIKRREYIGADNNSCTKYLYRNRYSGVLSVFQYVLYLCHIVEQVCTVLPVLLQGHKSVPCTIYEHRIDSNDQCSVLVTFLVP